MIHNRIEQHVQDAYRDLLSHFPGFCGCEVCQADVLVYSLNRLPARYVASEEGRVLTELNLDQQQTRANIEVVVLEAFAKVISAPRCTRAKAKRAAP